MCKQKKDFSWPVNGTSQENYEAFSTWFTQHEEILKEHHLVIWGAGSRGSEFANLMKKMGFYNFLFVDSNPKMWGGYVCSTEVISPDELENHRGKIILVSPENSYEIEKYLDLNNYRRNKDYFLIETEVEEAYVEEFLRPYDRETLILGSCEFTAICINDHDLTCMKDMIFQNSGKIGTKILTIHGIGLRAQYNILYAQIANGMRPKRLLLQIGMDTLIAKDHLFPHTQHLKLLKMLQDIQKNPSKEFLEYIQIASERSKNSLMNPFEELTQNGQISKNKIRSYYQYYYMANLNRNTEGLIYLEKILDEAISKGIKIMPFVLPVNYQLARELFEDKFELKYKNNLKKIEELLEEKNISLLDLSYSLDSKLFAWPEAPNASLNSQGRKKTTELLCQAIKEMM